MAETIHALSRRHKEPFLPLNCGAVSPNLIESELFGHERGSFTGADRLHRGYFERANRGTLFLDEITEMPLELQVKLLRVLETGKVTRVGGNEPINVDVRVHRGHQPPARARRWPRASCARTCSTGSTSFPIQLPPLRERTEDVELLAEHFLAAAQPASTTRTRSSRARPSSACAATTGRATCASCSNVVQRAFILADEQIGLDASPWACSESAGLRASTSRWARRSARPSGG